jgi:hypothetical protein
LLEGCGGVARQSLPKLSAVGAGLCFAGESPRASVCEPAQVERAAPPLVRLASAQQVGAADGLGERSQAEGCQVPADFLRDEEQIPLNRLRGRGELGAQLGPLGRDSDRAGVEMARTDHQAALRNQQGSAERHLVGAQECGDDDITPGLEPAVGAEAHAPAEAALDESALRLRQAELPRHSRVFDRGEWARAGPAVGARDVDDVGQRLRHSRCDEADP